MLRKGQEWHFLFCDYCKTKGQTIYRDLSDHIKGPYVGGYTIQLYKCFEQVVPITTIDGILIKKRLTIIRMGHERDNRRGRIY